MATAILSSLSSTSSSSPTVPSPSKPLSINPIATTIPFKSQSKFNNRLIVRSSSSSSPMIEKETTETHRPDTFLREDSASNSSTFARARFEKMIREAHDSVCVAIEVADGGGKSKEDVWSRSGGDGGISRVLQEGKVWEKAGVNVYVVYLREKDLNALKMCHVIVTRPNFC